MCTRTRSQCHEERGQKRSEDGQRHGTSPARRTVQLDLGPFVWKRSLVRGIAGTYRTQNSTEEANTQTIQTAAK